MSYIYHRKATSSNVRIIVPSADSRPRLRNCWQKKKQLHVGLWQVLRSFNIDEELLQAIQALYENSSSEVLLNSQLGEVFKITVGVRQRCLLSPILFNLFL